MNNFPLFAQEIQTSMNIPADSDTIPLYSTITTSLLTSKLDKPNTTYFTDNKQGDLIYFQTNLSGQTTCGKIKKNDIPDDMPSAMIGSVSYIDNNSRNSLLSSTGIVPESFGEFPKKWSWYNNGQYELLLAQEREIVHKFFLTEAGKATMLRKNINKATEFAKNKAKEVSRSTTKFAWNIKQKINERLKNLEYDTYTGINIDDIFNIMDPSNSNPIIKDLRLIHLHGCLASFKIHKKNMSRHITYRDPHTTHEHTHIITQPIGPGSTWPRFDITTNTISIN